MPRHNETPRKAHLIPMTDDEHARLKALAHPGTISQYVDELFSRMREIKVPQKPKNRNIQMSAETWQEIKQSGLLFGISAASAFRGAVEAAYIDQLNRYWGTDDQSL